MRRYETIFIVRPNAGEDDITGILDKVSSIVTGDDGTVIRMDKWGLKKLAYLIDKQSQGYYVYIDYAGLPSTVAEIERIFKIDDRLIKYMTVKLTDACDPEAIIAELEATAAQAEEKAENDDDSNDDNDKKD